MVSPLKKDGWDAGAGSGSNQVTYAAARPDGSRILFVGGGGPVGEANAGLQKFVFADRGPDGWRTKSALSRPQPLNFRAYDTNTVLVSEDVSHVAFSAKSWYGENHPAEPTPALYLSPLGEPGEWVSEPRSPDAAQSSDLELFGAASFVSAGGSPDLSTYYFAYNGTLLPGETARAAILGQVPQAGGLYAYRDGELFPVGVLPDGTRPTYGAAFIGTTEITNGVWKDERFSNQVSRDGRRAFFVSPDPRSGAAEPPQLYMREDLQRTVLISRDQTSGAAAAGVASFNDTASGLLAPFAQMGEAFSRRPIRDLPEP